MFCSALAERLGQRPLEAGDVGAALGGGDDVHVGLDPASRSPSPQRTAMSMSRSRSTSVGSMCPASSSIGTVSVNRSCPRSRMTSVIERSGARNSQNSEMPPSCRKVSSVTSAVRASTTCSAEPGHQEAGLPGPVLQVLQRELGVA